MSKEDIGTDYMMAFHDSFVHRAKCPDMSALIYYQGVVPLKDTMYKVCIVCWPVT